MKNFFIFLILSQVLFASNNTYQSTVYVFCDSKKALDAWTQFDIANDIASKKAYYGKKCFQLQEDISVSGVETHWGKVSFYYKGYKVWGYREGIK